MPEMPLLVFPSPARAEKSARQRPFDRRRLPPIERQQERLAPQFAALQGAFDARRAELQDAPLGSTPEQVLVLETAGEIKDFVRAVNRIPGMEWLAEWDTEDLTDDEDFYVETDTGHRPVGRKLYLVMTNQRALHELKSLWDRYQADPLAKMDGGLTRFRNMFACLYNIRWWNAQDRLDGTGILEDWHARLVEGQEIVRFEAELWWRGAEGHRAASDRFTRAVTDAGGHVVTDRVIEGIGYHGILAQVPIGAIQQLVSHQDTRLLQCDEIMYFRPLGQCAVLLPGDPPARGPEPPAHPEPTALDPVVAVLDGLPLANHGWLRDRLIVDDPEEWGEDYQATERQHGTAMCSLIVNGELDAGETALARPIYARPILRPGPPDWRNPQQRVECIPANELPVDLVHRAVQRIFKGDGGEPAAAPSVKIINLSVGDPARPFDRMMSAWGRLIDLLSWQHKVLVVVSAGNFLDRVELDLGGKSFSDLQGEEQQAALLRSMADSVPHRRLLSPSEAINALTVGAVHDDCSEITNRGRRRDFVCEAGVPSPVTRLGMGYRRSVKPDLLAPGGRQLYDDPLLIDGTVAAFRVNDTTNYAPGHRVASPGVTPGDLKATRFVRGTSNAAALTTRAATVVYEMLQDLRSAPGGEMLNEDHIAVLLKVLLVHGCAWGASYERLERALAETHPRLREYVMRFLGYGILDANRVLACAAQRVTAVGSGSLTEGASDIYTVPLPPSLARKAIWRRLTVTLAWLTPIVPSANAYRQAHLWFDIDGVDGPEGLDVDGAEADAHAVQRGTVQHQVFTGRRATTFMDDAALHVQVNCRQQAGRLREQVPYALAVTLEVAPGVDVPIYEEVAARIRPKVPVSATTSVE